MQLIDLKSLAGRMSLSVFSCRKYIHKGMPCYRIGRKILVDPVEVAMWLEQFRENRPEVPDGPVVQ
jgi:hypothetical protein